MANVDDASVLLKPVFNRHGLSLGPSEEGEDGERVLMLRGPWRPGQVNLHVLGITGAPDFRLEAEIDIPIASEDTMDGLPTIIDPDAVVRATVITCKEAFAAFFQSQPDAEDVLDPDASGLYVRHVTIAGITETVALTILVGCDVVGGDPQISIPRAGELLCSIFATLQSETPFFGGQPNRVERRRRGSRSGRR